MARIPTRLISRKVLQGGVCCAPQVLTGIDILNSHMGIPVVQVYPQGLDLGLMEHSLKAMLARYPLLSGRLGKDADGHAVLKGNDAGAGFRVHQCQGALPPFGPDHHFGQDLRHFHTPIYPWQALGGKVPIFHVDLYRFDDGGVVLSLTAIHSLMDGSSFWLFMQEWSALARGVAPTGERSMDRRPVITQGLNHRSTPYTRGYVQETTLWQRLGIVLDLTLNHFFRLEKGVIRVPASTLERWRHEARHQHPDSAGVTPSEWVTAHVMRALSCLWPTHQDRCLGLVIDLRFKRRLRLARDFFGNALGHAEVMLTQDALAHAPLATLALATRLGADQLTTEDLQGYLGLMERHRQRKTLWHLMVRSVARTQGPGLVLNNCSHYPMYDIDFGTGRPSWHDASRVVFRMLMLVPVPEQDGGMDLHITATRTELMWLAHALGAHSAPRDAATPSGATQPQAPDSELAHHHAAH